MRFGINRLGAWLTVAVVGAAGPAWSQSSSESEPTDVDSRWIPSFSINVGATMQYMGSRARSRCQNGRPEEEVPVTGTNLFITRLACTDANVHDPNLPSDDPAFAMFGLDPPITPGLFDPNCPDTPSADGRSACLRPTEEGDDLAVSALVGATLELATPRLAWIPGSPRLFAGGELLTLYAQERSIAKEGNPGAVGLPPNNQRATQAAGGALFGTGSAVTSEVQRLAWSARAGFAFPFTFRERRLWLKSSFGWFRYEVDFTADLVAGIKPDPVTEGTAGTLAPGFNEVSFSGKGSETFDAIGPGLELEMEAGRFGPLGVSLFLNGAAYWVQGDRRFGFSDTVDCPAFDPDDPTGGCASSATQVLMVGASPTPVPGAHLFVDHDGDASTPQVLRALQADTYTADFQFGIAPTVYRAGVGIRFHWLGR